MLRVKVCGVFVPLVRQARLVSGYKINSDRRSADRLPENFSEEDAFREKIEVAILNRARTKLRGLEKVEYMDIVKRTEGTDPNDAYRDKADFQTYRSFKRYFFSAERERRRQNEEGVWWKTLNFWLKQRENTPKFKNIGYDLPRKTRKEVKAYIKERKSFRKDEKLEKGARERTLILDPETVMDEWEVSREGIKNIQTIAHHYNIYRDLFGESDFLPILPLEIGYECGKDYVNPVYYGNKHLPSEAATQPLVYFEPKSDKLYTLLLTNPDEHLENNNSEYIHWLVGNIPGNNVSDGETLVDYLRPFPARGTGYQRMVFILFEQLGEVNFESERRSSPCTSLHERDFKTSEFFAKFQEHLTPVSLLFYQCKWDETVQKTFYEILDMQEPVYEYAKLTEKPRLSRIRRHPRKKTLEWLSKFMPKEPVYPDGSPESIEAMRQAAVEASATPIREDRKPFPIRKVY